MLWCISASASSSLTSRVDASPEPRVWRARCSSGLKGFAWKSVTGTKAALPRLVVRCSGGRGSMTGDVSAVWSCKRDASGIGGEEDCDWVGMGLVLELTAVFQFVCATGST